MKKREWIHELDRSSDISKKRLYVPNKPLLEQLLDLLCAILILVAIGLYGALLY